MLSWEPGLEGPALGASVLYLAMCGLLRWESGLELGFWGSGVCVLMCCWSFNWDWDLVFPCFQHCENLRVVLRPSYLLSKYEQAELMLSMSHYGRFQKLDS
jgi:hypothetical protein